VSLILEALKKLERDKQVESRGGFLVMAARPWPSEGGGRRTFAWLVVAVIAALAIPGTLVTYFLVRGSGHAPATATAKSAAAAPAVPTAVPLAASVPAAAPTAAYAPPPGANRSTSFEAAPMAAPPATARGADTQPRRPTPLAVVPEPAAVAPAGAASAASGSRFHLTAISERDGKPMAIINERLLFVGDSLDDATVVRIGDSDVELKVAGKAVVITF
jgi:hypothetical protein